MSTTPHDRPRSAALFPGFALISHLPVFLTHFLSCSGLVSWSPFSKMALASTLRVFLKWAVFFTCHSSTIFKFLFTPRLLCLTSLVRVWDCKYPRNAIHVNEGLKQKKSLPSVLWFVLVWFTQGRFKWLKRICVKILITSYPYLCVKSASATPYLSLTKTCPFPSLKVTVYLRTSPLHASNRANPPPSIHAR